MIKPLSLSVLSFLVIGLTACSQSFDAGNPQPSAIVAASTTPIKVRSHQHPLPSLLQDQLASV